MPWAEPLPYAVSGLVAIITAYLTHRRATKAHDNSVVVDHQTLVNDTYSQVLGVVNDQLNRQTKHHDQERANWEERENVLMQRIEKLTRQVQILKDEITDLKRKEERIATRQSRHIEDSQRHMERRHAEDQLRLDDLRD